MTRATEKQMLALHLIGNGMIERYVSVGFSYTHNKDHLRHVDPVVIGRCVANGWAARADGSLQAGPCHLTPEGLALLTGTRQ